MPSWRYAATDLLSGNTLSDDLPLTVQSLSQNLNGTGTLTGTLPLNKQAGISQPFINALTCRRALLWALADEWPVWAGLQLDWPQSSMQQQTLSISAQTIDALWGKRLITDTLEYPQVDLFTAFLDLAQYGMTKQSSYISPVSPAATRKAGYLDMVASQGGVAGLMLPHGIRAGSAWTASYTYSDLTQVSSAWSDMCSSGNLEYWFQPGYDTNGNLAIFLRLGYTQLGRPLSDSNIVLSYPGNCIDYGWPVTGSQSSNLVWGTAAPNGAQMAWMSQWPHGADQADLESFPLMETTASWQGSVVTSQSQINNWADGQVAIVTAGMTTPSVILGGGARPALKDIRLGDGAFLVITSSLHPPRADGSPGIQEEVRVTGWTATPPGADGQGEQYQIATSSVISAAGSN